MHQHDDLVAIEAGRTALRHALRSFCADFYVGALRQRDDQELDRGDADERVAAGARSMSAANWRGHFIQSFDV